MTGTVSATGPEDGWYTVEFKPDECPPEWLGKPTPWHYRVRGETLCGAHRQPNRVSHRQQYRVAAQPPAGQECQNCLATAKKSGLHIVKPE